MFSGIHRSIIIAVVLLICGGLFGSARASVYYNAQDGSRPKDFSLVKKGDTWYWIGIHYFEGSGPPGPASDGLYLATSKDLARWTDQGPVVLVGDTGTWDSYDLWAPSIVLVDNTYHIFYTGVQSVGNQLIQKIGHATSTDLINWTKDPNPVFDCSTTTWQYWNVSDPWNIGEDCRDPFVIRDEPNSRWVMFYNGRSKDPVIDPINPAVRWNPTPAVVGVAYSTDLATWSDGGFLPATAGAQIESPHAFSHNGTWYLAWTNNCTEVVNGSYTTVPNQTTCIKYSTASTLTGPYGAYANLPGVGIYDFASEAFTDGTNEYFGRITGSSAAFDQISWTSGNFGLTAIPYATVVGTVWFDLNRNGRIDPGEQGLDGARLIAYIDDGNGVLDTNLDTVLGVSITAYNATLTSLKHGTYKFQTIPAGVKVWVVVQNSNFTSTLADYVSSTGNLISSVDVPSATVVIGKSYGFQYGDMTPPAQVNDLRAP